MKYKLNLRKIGTKIALVSFLCIFVTVSLSIAIMLFGSNLLTDQIYSEDAATSISSLKSKTEEMEVSSLQCAKSLATMSDVMNAVESGQKGEILSALNEGMRSLKTDVEFVTVTDAGGKVVARTNSDNTGDSIANRTDIQAALKGGSGTAIGTGTQVALSVRSSIAVMGSSGQVAGVISAGYDLSNPKFVDNLKTMTGSQYTVFLKDTRLSTTLTNSSGKRETGTKLDSRIADLVLNQKQDYSREATLFGVRYYTRYEPIPGSDGKPIGIFFTGKPIASAKALETKVVSGALAAALLMVVLVMFLFSLFSKKYISGPIVRMSALAGELARGNLKAEMEPYRSRDEIGALGDALLSMRATLNRYIADISSRLSLLASGDMTAEASQEYIGDFAPIHGSLQKITASLNGMLLRIDRSAKQVSAGAGQVSSGAQSLAQGAAEQASSVEQLSATITDIADKARQNTDGIARVTRAVRQAVENVGDSGRQMQALLSAMKEISEASGQIEKIIKAIDEIAFQTNILALNAAVEAARAGAAGKGFAVVAEEVRNLAGKSAGAAKETARLIRNSLEKVEEGSRLAEKTAETADQAYQKLQGVDRETAAIDAVSSAQASAISQVSQGIQQVSGVVQANSATAEQSAAASEELSGQSALLLQEVSRFRLNRSEKED